MNLFIRLAITVAVQLLNQTVLYFGCEIFQKDPHNVLSRADAHIPFVPWAALMYVTWFPLIAVFPLVLYYCDTQMFAAYMAAVYFNNVISVLIYLIYPTSFKRPVPADDLSGKLMKIVYKGSFRGVNCAPSLHCSSCMMIIVFSLLNQGMPSVLRAVFCLFGLGITVSTMLTKQHALIDFITAIPMAALSFFLGSLLPASFLLPFILH